MTGFKGVGRTRDVAPKVAVVYVLRNHKKASIVLVVRLTLDQAVADDADHIVVAQLGEQVHLRSHVMRVQFWVKAAALHSHSCAILQPPLVHLHA